ncbi:MAG: hypothetical protein PSV40_00995 [Polaromonas sp.]|uniref:hypothetical protein n=1 Tax=Polaromonas sp. TaxID=1869339 RepID=UPI00248856CB|nr:hypothetical protein [Polaromonas sp.]MDI1267667.1 hypothetical protein [Polaromonas sp.]
MKRNDWWPTIPQPAMACALLIGAWALTAGSSHAASAVGTVGATVVESVTVVITPPPAPTPVATPAPAPAVVETPALAGTVFTVESFTSSLSTSGPLLRVGGAPPSGTGGSGVQGSGAAEGGGGTQGATATQGSVGAGAAPPAASTATVNVTRKADGSLAVSGGSGLTFAVSEPVNGAVNIEYN